MKVELIDATPEPETLVCTAARNDYREDGVIGHGFTTIMDEIEPEDEHLEEIGLADTSDSAVSDPEGYTEAQKRTLIDHLIGHGHWGPFEHPQATVAIEGVTRVVTHQIVRHRHFTYDQQSFRYVELDDIDPSADDLFEYFQLPEFKGEDYDVDREGVHDIEDMEYVKRYYRGAYSWSVYYYQQLLEIGVPREQARKVLPMGIKTNIVMSGNARAWMHILNVRTKGNVQGETKRCADTILDRLEDWMPYTFKKYREDVLPLKLNP